MPTARKPTCKKCGQNHWTFMSCTGEHHGANAAKAKQEQRRNGIQVLEHVDSPPLPTLKPSSGYRAWGDRLSSFDHIGGGTLMRKKEA